jgi:YHS domain-containing protein
MTSRRRRGKPWRFASALRLWAILAFAAWACGIPVLATTTERVVTDAQTGLAIGGYDPVAYFIDEAAKPGRANYEFQYSGAAWRFRNAGNLAAFMDNPTDYAPRFGGYDPVAVGRGAPTPGNPEIWLIFGQKLYLFYSLETRDEFRVDPRRASAQADAKWTDVLKLLAR